MAASHGLLLVSSSALAVGTVNCSSLYWSGGTGLLVTVGAVYPATGVQLQILGPDPQGTWVTIGSSALNSMIQFPIPQGQVRLALIGSSSGISAALTSLTY